MEHPAPERCGLDGKGEEQTPVQKPSLSVCMSSLLDEAVLRISIHQGDAIAATGRRRGAKQGQHVVRDTSSYVE